LPEAIWTISLPACAQLLIEVLVVGGGQFAEMAGRG